MEEDVLRQNFVEISTMLVAGTSQSLDRKASSTKALSKTHTGILGVQRERGPANHSPLVMECAISSWPNVTLPGYDEIGSTMLDVSHSRAAVFAPLLWGEGAALEWEAYAVDNALLSVRDVVSNGIRSSDFLLQENGSSHSDMERHDLQGDTGPMDQALFGDSSSSMSTLRVPAWQVAPAELMTEGIMWDYYSHPQYKAPIDRILRWNNEGSIDRGRRSMVTHEEMAAGEGPLVAATELIPCGETLLPLQLNAVPNTDPIHLSGHGHEGNTHGCHRSLLTGTTSEGVCSALFHPVYDAQTSGSDNSQANISGVTVEIFSWTDIFMDIYHGHVNDVAQVVIESKLKLPDGNHRSKLASYLVHSGGASFIGMGRLVGQGHEDMLETYEFSFPNDNVIYSFEIYPTQEMCDRVGTSKKPTFLAIIASCFFLLSVLVFFVYDYFVK